MGLSHELITHVEALLASQEWTAAALHVRLGAQQVSSRAQAQVWRRLLEGVPVEVQRSGDWPHARAWVAYRTNDRALLESVLIQQPDCYPAFEAFLASMDGRWAQVLEWSAKALDSDSHCDSADAVIARRFQASALAELGLPDWKAAFAEARRSLQGRDRGVLGLDFAYHLIRAGQEGAARDVLAQAVTDLRGDTCLLTLALSNLGISCLRLGELADAEQSLRRAVAAGGRPEGRTYLATAWRGLGGLYLRQGQFARAAYAFEMAQAKAEAADDRTQAMRSSALVARLQGRYNDALAELYQVLHHDQIADAQPHAVYADLAAVRLLAGDRVGARTALRLVPPGSVEDHWRAGVVQAELLRLEGQADIRDALQAVGFQPAWACQEAWVFPELFAQIGVVAPRPIWEAEVSVDGPVRVVMGGVEAPLKAHRPAASLLVFLLMGGGRVSVDRAVDALTLPGVTPRRQQQELSRTVRELWEALGWRDAVRIDGGLVCLSDEVVWRRLVFPLPERTEMFCEGRYDRWILEWRDEHGRLN
ncbi:tetratricopeptide repeat protein [Deinococcus frigens]|uniref:tetratricopeptide repeat protein n=1 Tax=Deinococcus frigens TaxID=249403 RepID=UPI000495A77B|nr:tetratricopeptide repeat protein [Deinococcus frigens]